MARLSFFDLRHTAASYLVMSGVDLPNVKDILGHREIEMTLRYSHLAPAHKARAMEFKRAYRTAGIVMEDL